MRTLRNITFYAMLAAAPLIYSGCSQKNETPKELTNVTMTEFDNLRDIPSDSLVKLVDEGVKSYDARYGYSNLAIVNADRDNDIHMCIDGVVKESNTLAKRYINLITENAPKSKIEKVHKNANVAIDNVLDNIKADDLLLTGKSGESFKLYAIENNALICYNFELGDVSTINDGNVLYRDAGNAIVSKYIYNTQSKTFNLLEGSKREIYCVPSHVDIKPSLRETLDDKYKK